MNKLMKVILAPLIRRIKIEEDKIVHAVCREMRKENSLLLGEIARNNYAVMKVPLLEEERIRIVFLFQVSSFWPSIEPFYEEVLNDPRFDVKLLCYDERYDRTIKTETSRQYLENMGMDFVAYEDFDIDTYRPHVVVLQTPYDTNRAKKYKTVFLKGKGYRVVYIPYGIEIADTGHAKEAHFSETVVQNCWRLYTLSDTMKQDYFKYCANASAVRALGLPKFDALYHPEKFPMWDEVRKRAGGKKIVLWKVHFPKVIQERGKNILVTPYIEEYIEFAKQLASYDDLFFVFMPHPRFREFNEDAQVKQNISILMKYVEEGSNVYIDEHDDYRNSLINADYIIVDRSAVMVEAGSVGVPVLYMYNPDFNEPLTKAILPLMSSYYQGTSCTDMKDFLVNCMQGKDPLKAEREKAFKECIPYFDGQCGRRIKEDIIEGMKMQYD